MELSVTFLQYFESLEDPRSDNHNRRHKLTDILIITILGCICGADNWNEICEFAEAKYDWLSTFLELPSGIPSHDTFNRVFSLIDPEKFHECFNNWISSLTIDIEKEIIAIDGKTLRGSHHQRKGKKPLHLVSAWATQAGIMLGQLKTDEKSNEIEAIPKLLKMIDIEGSVITLDAMGCQQSIAKNILSGGADYVLSLKANQKTLHADVQKLFQIAEQNKQKQYKNILHLRKIEKIRDHGRFEIRKYTLVSPRDELALQLRWPGVNGIGKLEVKRMIHNKTETSVRYFLTSLNYERIDDFMRAVRSHWNIEINLHWSLDVSFREDLNRTRTGHAAQNLGIVRRIALNLLKQEKTAKVGISGKRKKSGWDNKYLLKVLTADRNIHTKNVQNESI